MLHLVEWKCMYEKHEGALGNKYTLDLRINMHMTFIEFC